MPKQKSHSGASKRFQITGSGKIKRKSAFKRHGLRKRTVKQKRGLGTALIHENDAPRLIMLLER